ncbi:MAG: hypothetical protein FWD86_01610 [Firmicutes bacterium]|nr:hypothetical protein [Bacillota bacterium]
MKNERNQKTAKIILISFTCFLIAMFVFCLIAFVYLFIDDRSDPGTYVFLFISFLPVLFLLLLIYFYKANKGNNRILKEFGTDTAKEKAYKVFPYLLDDTKDTFYDLNVFCTKHNQIPCLSFFKTKTELIVKSKFSANFVFDKTWVLAAGKRMFLWSEGVGVYLHKKAPRPAFDTRYEDEQAAADPVDPFAQFGDGARSDDGIRTTPADPFGLNGDKVRNADETQAAPTADPFDQADD